LDTIKWDVFLCLLLGTFYLQAQEEQPWYANRPLSWSDFRGPIEETSGASAITASGISYSFSTYFDSGEMKVDYQVQAFFYPTKSWYRPSLCTDIILAHEQLHFDISELFARKMSREMVQTKFTKNVKAEVKSIYRKTLRDLNDFQNKYDGQTDFSRNRLEQERWILEIEKALE